MLATLMRRVWSDHVLPRATARGGSERLQMDRSSWAVIRLLLPAPMIASAPAAAQVGFDRPGGDYTSFTLRAADPAQCASRCERDQRCRAWAFSYPVTESSNAVCWLK